MRRDSRVLVNIQSVSTSFGPRTQRGRSAAPAQLQLCWASAAFALSDLDAVSVQTTRYLRAGVQSSRAQVADFAALDELACAVNWEHDVDIALEGGAVETDAGVTLDDVRRRRVPRDHAKRLISAGERCVTPEMQTGGRHQRNA